jgi:septal ring factor EnvC (AmiA/AmiB activator)
MASRKIARVGLMVGAGIFLGAVATAQSIEQQRRELASAKSQADQAEARASKLESQAANASSEADRYRARAASVAAQIQAAEADITASEARIRLIDRMRLDQRARLATMQQPAVRMVAALQMMARRPPALALVQPGSTRDLVHVRSVLEGMMPAIRKRTEGIRAEIAEGRRLRTDAQKALGILAAGQTRLSERRKELVQVEARYRATSSSFRSGALVEQDRAIALGERARDIVELIDELGTAATTREALESLPGPLLRPDSPGTSDAAPPESLGRAQGLGPYRLPVAGRLVTGLGEVSNTGVRARGLTIAPRADAQVVAPASGRVVYAGSFKGYGQIVILDHGRGWTSLITNMASIGVRVGDSLLAGSPIGKAGPGTPRITVELRKGSQPVDITPNLG